MLISATLTTAQNWRPALLLSLFVMVVATTSCATGHRSAHAIAAEHGFRKTLANGTRWQHVVFEKEVAAAENASLRVYIEGDGKPWLDGRYPAPDPTPDYALAMALMALDPGPAIYLGRPCYFGMTDSPACEPRLWTSARYSEEVVASMAGVIRRYQNELQISHLVLIGYSGGGALATLLTAELGGDIVLVTIAGNLDTDAWTSSRGYLPLSESLNPVDSVAALAETQQLHLIGGRDEVVPPAVTRSFTRHLGDKSTREYPEFDHRCCWVDAWPAILGTIPDT